MCIHLVMELHKTTPHKYRYKALDVNAPVGDIYIRREAFKKVPTTISVTINPIEA